MYDAIRPFLFKIDAELAHGLGHRALGAVEAIAPLRQAMERKFVRHDERLQVNCFGLQFPNPVGLAAGFDKDGEHPLALAALGFGFLELGTVTAFPQPGNPAPRLFRLPQDHALLNRMGFNNHGAKALARNLKGKKASVPLGINLGKSKVTPNDEALSDYLLSLDAVYDAADYLVVNVSSPNTPGLRELQEKEPLRQLLSGLRERMQTLSGKLSPKPLLLKLAPDLNDHQLGEIIDLLGEVHIDGLIATNTTISREGLRTSPKIVESLGTGGISGLPVAERANRVIRFLYEGTGGKVPIVGVGGIFSGEDAVQKLKAGASLVQVYTGFIYGGPGTIARIVDEMLVLAVRDGVKNINEWVGAER